jgi:hypothetical protein
MNCRGLSARPSPVGNGGGKPSRTHSGHRQPGGPEPGGPAGPPRRARLLEWDHWMNCRGLSARPSPVGNGGRGSVTRAPLAPLAGRAGAGRARSPPPVPLVPTLPSTPYPVLGGATSGGEGAARMICSPPPRSSSATIHGSRAAGVGAAVRARAGYVGGHPGTTRLLLWPASGSAH